MRALLLLLTAAALGCAGGKPAPTPAETGGRSPSIPITYRKLPNGLRVVLSPDHSAPTAVVAVYYGIGFRNEPRDRTGFAHLFEHMMFQGSRNLGKMEFIKLVQSSGGVLNGSTRFDFTNYFQIVPSNTLQTVLWAEADRMKGLNITQDNLTNQQGVVKSEVRVNVLNRPYGGFPWLDMPQYANTNWYNAHNFYGELKDLDAATLPDVQGFFARYYAPGNAVLVVTGDIDEKQTLAWIDQYFGPIPAREVPPTPDISEPKQVEEKRASKEDKLATRPALAFAYHVPPRNTPEWYAMGLLDQILGQGKDSRLYDALVTRTGLTGEIEVSINGLGNMFNIQGPTLWTVSLFHDAQHTPEEIMGVVEKEMEKARAAPPDAETMSRALVKLRSSLYDTLEEFSGFGRADLLASYALFDDAPQKINSLEDEFRKVTPELVQKTAQEYLRPTNRTVLTVIPKGGEAK
jgi:predicted Zn-dependent peptidase